jgi:hypothetical protein
MSLHDGIPFGIENSKNLLSFDEDEFPFMLLEQRILMEFIGLNLGLQYDSRIRHDLSSLRGVIFPFGCFST